MIASLTMTSIKQHKTPQIYVKMMMILNNQSLLSKIKISKMETRGYMTSQNRSRLVSSWTYPWTMREKGHSRSERSRGLRNSKGRS